MRSGDSKEKEINEPGKRRKIRGLRDLVLSILGLVAMNGVIQLLLYPGINRALGEERYGDILSMLAVVSVLSASIGTGANYARMVAETKGRGANGDFNVFLLISMVPVTVISVIASFLILGNKGLVFNLLFILLSAVSVVRYYGDVEFRLNVNYVRFFLYYVIIAVGYIGGSFLIRYSVLGDDASWVTAILIGESLAVAFVAFTGKIFKGKNALRLSPDAKANLKTTMFLLATNLINALALQADKLLLRIFMNGEAVTIFYLATLVGKVVAMLTTPLNGVIIGYLAKYKGKFTKKFFGTVTLTALVVAVLFTVLGVVASHIFVGWMYPDSYAEASQYFIFANAGQIFYFVAGTMMIIVLRFVHERYQLIVNSIYAAVFIAALVPLVINFGIAGITWGLLGVNVLRFIAVVIIGFAHTENNDVQTVEENGSGEDK
ncbi:MAG: hypothetical protein J6112_05750 [Clostridia bacterium]|nr:hypothetical protein [Clostridia bacterium]